VVRFLVDRGAEVNAQGGYYGNVLQAASRDGHEAVVRFLVDRGAEVNAQAYIGCSK
jgi:ankyrin repeat protein